MRAKLIALILTGCGAVHLGDERSDTDVGMLDAGTAQTLDTGLAEVDAASETLDTGLDALDSAQRIRVDIVIRSEGGCDGCFQLRATGSGGQAPYLFAWEDGSRGDERRVCSPATTAPFSVVARDAMGAVSAPFVARLGTTDAPCPLCIQNASFEGTPAGNVVDNFDCVPWSTCSNPSTSNSPDILMKGTLQDLVVPLLPATQGSTYLGLMGGEQATQTLCAPVRTGAPVSLQLDLGRILLAATGMSPDAKEVFLEIWGGMASDCSARELLWTSEALATEWHPYCATLRPQSAMDSLTLRARGAPASGSTYVIVDNLRPVSTCP